LLNEQLSDFIAKLGDWLKGCGHSANCHSISMSLFAWVLVSGLVLLPFRSLIVLVGLNRPYPGR
jgi:hypothetical protein